MLDDLIEYRWVSFLQAWIFSCWIIWMGVTFFSLGWFPFRAIVRRNKTTLYRDLYLSFYLFTWETLQLIASAMTIICIVPLLLIPLGQLLGITPLEFTELHSSYLPEIWNTWILISGIVIVLLWLPIKIFREKLHEWLWYFIGLILFLIITSLFTLGWWEASSTNVDFFGM